MKRILISLVGLASVLGMSAASAADFPVKAASMVSPTPNWTGFYLGINGGYGTGSGTATDVTNGASISIGQRGWLGGGQAGFNWQWGPAIIGIEGDYGWGDINGSTQCPNVFFQCNAKISSLSSVRGRLGYAASSYAMIYLTGGYGWARQNFNATSPLGGGGQTQTLGGFVGGVGAELAMWPSIPNLTVKGEWLHYALNNSSDTYAIGIPAAPSTVFGRTSLDVFRLGLNYRLNWLR